MHPILLSVGETPVYSYTVFQSIAIAAAFALGIARARSQGIALKTCIDGGLAVILTGLIGSKLPFIARNLLRMREQDGAASGMSFSEIIGLWNPSASTVVAGVIIAILLSPLYARWFKVPFLLGADIIAPCIALGQGLGRIACLFAGCCHGDRCTLPWALHYPEQSLARLRIPDAGVHPSPVYAAVFGLALCWFLIKLGKRHPPRGTLMASYLAAAGAFRIWLDTTRYYPETAELASVLGVRITVYQGGAFAIMLAGITGLLLLYRSHGRQALK